MGSIVSALSSMYSSKAYKIILLGLNNAGKTSVLYSLQLGKLIKTQPTLGGNVEEIQYRNLTFLCWDLGGQAQLRSAWPLYYPGTNGVILVIDSTDRDKIAIIREELKCIVAHPDLQRAVLLILANKQDLSNAIPPENIVEELQLSHIIKHTWRIQPCSAVTQDGITAGMNWLAQQLKQMA